MITRKFASRPSTIARRAVGLAEVVVAASVLIILVGLQLMLVQGASSAFHKTNTQADLLQEIQVTVSRLIRDIQGSTLAGLSRNANGVGLVSAHLEEQSLQINSSGQPYWKRYVLYFVDTPSQELRWRALMITPPSDTPRPIEAYDFGAGLHPMVHYQVDGKRLVGSVEEFSVAATGGEITVSLKASRERYGSSRPESIQMHQTVFMRN